MTTARLLSLLVFAAVHAPLQAHIGSPDIFHEAMAGPYRLLVAIRPPPVIPGVAEIQIRSATPGIDRIRIVPLPLTGAGASFAPTPDVADRSKYDPDSFSGSLWMMSTGTWQVRVEAEGKDGKGHFSIPVPTLPARTLTMQPGLGAVLFSLMLVLAAGLVSIVGAGALEGQLEPGRRPSKTEAKRSRKLMGATAALAAGIAVLGNWWWNSEASVYSRNVYKPLQVTASLESNSRLKLRISDPGWLKFRKTDDFIPDHSHLMHLILIRIPRMERIWHLHPEQTESGVFVHDLPDMPAGRYQLFADVVHANGLPETMTTEFDLPVVTGKPLSGDDSTATAHPIDMPDHRRTGMGLPDGALMVWERDDVISNVLTPFRFRVQDKAGAPVRDMELYMGMPGHAFFIKKDRKVFAHVHPSGSSPMASLTLADPSLAHAAHAAQSSEFPSTVSFPFAFPETGDYRVFVQVKRAGQIQTGAFDVEVW
ncbi:MAG: hypothetical protein EXQ52_06855 [Bryobacterales bacterium]|nr:hypothetical protein [Bryobacterales bacterium]